MKKDEEKYNVDIHFPTNFQCEFSWDALLSIDDCLVIIIVRMGHLSDLFFRVITAAEF